MVADAPSIQEHLCTPCAEHFSVVRESLEQLGVDYSLNKFMVRGLDYYCRTTFEFITGDLGAQSAVCAGGRYDGLVALLGGPKVPGIGFGLGLERLILLLQQQDGNEKGPGIDLFVAGLGPEASKYGFALSQNLRSKGLSVALDHEGKSLKSQMKQADKADARFVLIIGDDELANGAGMLRDMENQEQQAVALEADEVAAVIQTLLPN